MTRSKSSTMPRESAVKNSRSAASGPDSSFIMREFRSGMSIGKAGRVLTRWGTGADEIAYSFKRIVNRYASRTVWDSCLDLFGQRCDGIPIPSITPTADRTQRSVQISHNAFEAISGSAGLAAALLAPLPKVGAKLSWNRPPRFSPRKGRGYRKIRTQAERKEASKPLI